MKIIKENRKSLSLKIDKDGEIILKIPRFVSEKIKNDFLEKHKDWILEKQNFIRQNLQKFEIGEKFLFFGDYFELKFDEKKKFYFDGKYFYSCFKDKENLKKEFIKFYKKEAKKYIFKRIYYFLEIFGLKFNNLKITSASTRWGSCSSKKNINFSFRLILAPQKSIDYVIIHELAHLREMNHSRQFWILVDNYFRQIYKENYLIYKKWLNENNLKTNF